MSTYPPRRKRPQPTDAQLKLLGRYKLLTSTLAIALGVLIVIKGIKIHGAITPILIGFCLCGLGISRIWIFFDGVFKKISTGKE